MYWVVGCAGRADVAAICGFHTGISFINAILQIQKIYFIIRYTVTIYLVCNMALIARTTFRIGMTIFTKPTNEKKFLF